MAQIDQRTPIITLFHPIITHSQQKNNNKVVQDQGLASIRVAKQFVQAGLGLDDPGLLSEGFYFLGMYVCMCVCKFVQNRRVDVCKERWMDGWMDGWDARQHPFDPLTPPPPPLPPPHHHDAMTADPLTGAEGKKAYLRAGEKLDLKKAFPDLDFRHVVILLFLCVERGGFDVTCFAWVSWWWWLGEGRF